VAPSAGAGAGRELARAFRLFAAAGVSVVCPAPATDGQLETVHVQRYVAAVRQAGGHGPGPSALAFGLGTEDNPVFAGMPRRAGGLHHAMSASGFACTTTRLRSWPGPVT
jgi:hypothetical protein